MEKIMRFLGFADSDRALGVGQSGQRYDIPLHQDSGTGFLLLLMALMVFLAFMASAAFFILGGISERWTSGLENQVTIEIPAERPDGSLRSASDIKALSNEVSASLSKDNNVRSLKILTENDIEDLLLPWLGDAKILSGMPLPGLIAVTLARSDTAAMQDIMTRLTAVDTGIRVDTHQEWLRDILSMARSLQFTALIVVAVIGFITFTAIAGAVHADIQVHQKDVELLHLIGAQDEYITRQFQRHILHLSMKGSLMGLALGICILGVILWFSGHKNPMLMPDLKISLTAFIALILLPVSAALISTLTARFTVLKALSRMP
jgi:cell division transport system permease protein